MAKTETIREFLVRLGFKVDPKSEQRFTQSIEKATTLVASLSAAVVASAGAVVAGTAQISEGLNKLYFSSQRTGSSARNLKAFSYAASQLGSNAGEAHDAVEGLAEKLKRSPGYENLLRGMGLRTRDAHGHLLGSVTLMDELAGRLRNMPQYEAMAYSNQLGIPYHLLMAMRNPKFQGYFNQYRSMSSHSGLDKATHSAHKFMVLLHQLGQQFDLIKDQAAGALDKAIGPDLDHLAQWARKDGPEIATAIAHIAKAVVNLTEDLTGMFRWLWKIDRTFGKWVFGLISGTNAGNALGATVAHAGAALGFSGAKTALHNNQLARERQRQGEAMRYFMAQGWSRAQAAGIVANLESESGLRVRATGDHGHAGGIAQWHAARREAYVKWTGKPFYEANFRDQLAFVQHELTHGESRAGRMLRAAHSARSAGSIVSRYYERPAAAAADAAKRGHLAQHIAATTTINVNGVHEPEQVARKVEEAQAHTNSSLVRNLKSVVQ